MHKYLIPVLLFVSLMSFAWASPKAALQAKAPVVLSGEAAHFDFMEIDAKYDRLLAAHAGAGSLELVDLKSGNSLKPIFVGHVQGVAIEPQSDTYVLGDADEHKIIFLSAKTLTKSGELKVNGPVDAIAIDTKRGVAYAGEDDGSHLWVVDVKGQKLIGTIELPGVPEFVAYDPVTDRIYQNIKTKDSLVVIQPATHKIETEWSTLPTTSPHGLAIDSKTGKVFIAGKNGKLVAIDLKTGKNFSEAEIAPSTDQITFDAGSKVIYCASKGFISTVRETASGLESLGNTPSPQGAHTLAVDTVRHEVWISFADKKHSYVQSFKLVE